MKILVTGGSGFIGTNIIDYYMKNGHDLMNIDIQPPKNFEHFRFWIKADINDLCQLEEIFMGFSPDIVIHMAARTDLNGKNIDDYRSNTDGVSNVIRSIKKAGSIKFVVFASSMLVCKIGYKPNNVTDYMPSTVYGESKIEGEIRVRKEAGKSFPWIIIRPTSIWGPWFGPPYKDFFLAIRDGLYLHPYRKRVKRSYGFVLNLVYQIDSLVIQNGANLIGETVYASDYEPIELKAWADSIQTCFSVRPIKEAPMLIFWIAAKIGDVLKLVGFKTVPMTSFRLNNLLTEMIHNTMPLQKVCGKLPYTVNEGVLLTCRWIQENDSRK